MSGFNLYRPALFAAVLVSATPGFIPTPADAQDVPITTPSTPSLLAREAMAYHFRVTKDPGFLAEQLYAATLHRQDVPPDEIRQRTLAKRRDWERLRREAIHGEWHANPYGQTITRLLGRAATHFRGAGGTGVEIANLAILAYEDLLTGVHVSRSAQRLVEEFDAWQDYLRSPEDSIVQLIQTTYGESATFREDIWDPLFLPLLGFRPTSPDLVVLDSYPQFARHEAISTVTSSLATNAQNLTALRGLQTETLAYLRENRAKIASLATTLAQREATQQERWAAEQAARDRRRQEQAAIFEMAAHRSAVNLAATVVGFGNPQLGRRIRATNDAVFRAREAVDAYDAAIASGVAEGVARLALTSSWFGLGLMLFDAVSATGPPTERIIIEEIEELRRQVAQLRHEMHDRFDHIHATLLKGFDALAANDRALLEVIRSVEADIRNTRLQLDDVREVLLDTQAILLRQEDSLRRLFTGVSFARCLRPHTPGEMTQEKFRDCLATVEQLAYLLPDNQLYLQSTTAQSAWLASLPDRMLASSLRYFKTLLREIGDQEDRAAVLADTVVGPESWLYVADLHDKFLGDHLTLATMDATAISDGRYARTMRMWRRQLVYYAEAIREELEAFQLGTRPTVFSRLLRDAWEPIVWEPVREWSRQGRDYDAEEIHSMQNHMAVINAHLRLWLGLAFHDVLARSEALGDIMSGAIRLPDRATDWAVSSIRLTQPSRGEIEVIPSGAAELTFVVGNGLTALEDALRSAAMRDVVRYGYGHSILMSTLFYGIDRMPDALAHGGESTVGALAAVNGQP